MSNDHMVVFAADTPIGRSACAALSKLHEVRAVVKRGSAPDPTLTSLGVKVVEVDLESRAEVTEVLRGAAGTFVQTISDNTRREGYNDEVRVGRSIADACERSGVGRVVYSSQLSVARTLGVRARHMDAKAEVDAYMRQLGLPVTAVVVPCLYEDFLVSPLKPTWVQQGLYALNIPMARVPLYLVSADDVGPIVASLLGAGGVRGPGAQEVGGGRFLGKTVSVCGDKLSVAEVAGVLSGCLGPEMRVQDKQVTLQEYRNLPYPGIDDMANMFDFFQRVDQRASLDLNKELHPGIQTFQQWVTANRDRVIKALEYTEPKKIDPWNV